MGGRRCLPNPPRRLCSSGAAQPSAGSGTPAARRPLLVPVDIEDKSLNRSQVLVERVPPATLTWKEAPAKPISVRYAARVLRLTCDRLYSAAQAAAAVAPGAAGHNERIRLRRRITFLRRRLYEWGMRVAEQIELPEGPSRGGASSASDVAWAAPRAATVFWRFTYYHVYPIPLGRRLGAWLARHATALSTREAAAVGQAFVRWQLHDTGGRDSAAAGPTGLHAVRFALRLQRALTRSRQTMEAYSASPAMLCDLVHALCSILHGGGDTKKVRALLGKLEEHWAESPAALERVPAERLAHLLRLYGTAATWPRRVMRRIAALAGSGEELSGRTASWLLKYLPSDSPAAAKAAAGLLSRAPAMGPSDLARACRAAARLRFTRLSTPQEVEHLAGLCVGLVVRPRGVPRPEPPSSADATGLVVALVQMRAYAATDPGPFGRAIPLLLHRAARAPGCSAADAAAALFAAATARVDLRGTAAGTAWALVRAAATGRPRCGAVPARRALWAAGALRLAPQSLLEGAALEKAHGWLAALAGAACGPEGPAAAGAAVQALPRLGLELLPECAAALERLAEQERRQRSPAG